MAEGARQKVTISLAVEVLNYADEYRDRHSVSSRSKVVTLALCALRERELAAGYCDLAEDYASSPDELLDSGLQETLDFSRPSERAGPPWRHRSRQS